MNDVATKRVSSDFSAHYILTKLLVGSHTTRSFHYLEMSILWTIDEWDASWTDIAARIAEYYNKPAIAIKLAIRTRLLLSVLFRTVDENFFSAVWNSQDLTTPLWKRRLNPEYVITATADYRREVDRLKRKS